MKITISTIPHSEQAYPTVGNYGTNEDGSIWIHVSETGNNDYNALIAVHELIEKFLVDKKGISDEEITNFDKKFEEARAAFPEIIKDGEPGDSVYAPYHNEHGYATSIEMNMSQQLLVDWADYNKRISEL